MWLNLTPVLSIMQVTYVYGSFVDGQASAGDKVFMPLTYMHFGPRAPAAGQKPCRKPLHLGEHMGQRHAISVIALHMGRHRDVM